MKAGAGITGFFGLAAGLVLAAACNPAPRPVPVETAVDGKTLYAENGCGSCHGPLGRGDGPISGTLDPRPTDFQESGAFVTGLTVEAVAATIADGIQLHAAPGVPSDHRQGMPRFPHLSDTERQSLARYVLSLRDPSH
ncbi:MAG: cytochrome c [Vicinamibacterales bacterium]